MPIFRCGKCGCIENTAMSRYWIRLEEERPLCSECDPKIKQWHGAFKKQPATGLLLGSDGFLYSPEENLEWRKKHQGLKIIGTISNDSEVEQAIPK